MQKPLSRLIQCSSWGLLGSGQRQWSGSRDIEVKLKDSGFDDNLNVKSLSLFFFFFPLFKKVRHRKAKMIQNNFSAITEPWFPICWSHVLSLYYSAFHNLQQFSLPLCLLQNGIVHQIQPPPFLCPLNLLPVLATPILRLITVTAFWLASWPPSSMAVQVIFHSFASSVSNNSPATLYSFKWKSRLWAVDSQHFPS